MWAVANADTNRVVLVRYTKPDGGAPRFSETVTTVALNASTLPSIWVTPASDTVWLTNGTGAVSRYRDDGNGGVVSETLTPTARPGRPHQVLLELRLGLRAHDVYVAGEDYNLLPGPRSAPPVCIARL